jgi:hypothetical protein
VLLHREENHVVNDCGTAVCERTVAATKENVT